MTRRRLVITSLALAIGVFLIGCPLSTGTQNLLQGAGDNGVGTCGSGNATLVFINGEEDWSSNLQVTTIYITPADSDDWGANLLSAPLLRYERFVVEIDPSIIYDVYIQTLTVGALYGWTMPNARYCGGDTHSFLITEEDVLVACQGDACASHGDGE